MLKNSLKTSQLCNLKLYLLDCRSLHVSNVLLGSKAGSSSLNRQAKVMGKLFGSRVAGSKQRWYPNSSSNGGSNRNAENNIFTAQHLSKPTAGAAGKQALRRINVLNKLFMTHITDQLAAGKAAELVAGRGLQITRVRVTTDFAFVLVYWLGNSEVDTELERQLKCCSGILRHELTQLCLIGHVPRIKFVHDKKLANVNEVEELLKHMKFDDANDENSEEIPDYVDGSATLLKADFYGDKVINTPEMRHDVLGLNHAEIMDRILLKMRKSKLAWDQHFNKTKQSNEEAKNSSHGDSNSTLKDLQQKLLQQNSAENDEKFKQFLNKRRQRRQFRGNKEPASTLDLALTAADEQEQLDWLTKQQRYYYEQQDYLPEEEDDDNNFGKNDSALSK